MLDYGILNNLYLNQLAILILIMQDVNWIKKVQVDHANF